MGITKLSKSGFTSSSYEKYNDFLAGNTAFNPTSYESIATVTVGSGGSTSVDFTSIPSTYTHLQIRCLARGNSAGTGTDALQIRFNSDTGSNYASHLIMGNGASALVDVATSSSYMYLKEMICRGGNLASTFSGIVIDILDYKSTNKNKTVRALGGHDRNGAGAIIFQSGLWFATPAAITSINLTGENNFAQYTQFALYGIKS